MFIFSRGDFIELRINNECSNYGRLSMNEDEIRAHHMNLTLLRYMYIGKKTSWIIIDIVQHSA